MKMSWIVALASLAVAAPRAGAVEFDQGVPVSPVLEAAREGARTAPAVTVAQELPAAAPAAAPSPDDRYSKDEALKAIEELGGNISGGMADIIAAVFKEKGRPTGVIVGREAQGAFVLGYRQGSGKVSFKGGASGQRIYWRAPSIGIQVGGSVNEATILVYNTGTYERLLQTFAAVKGSYHYVLGGGVTYLHEGLENEEGRINLAHVAVGFGLGGGVAIEGLTFSRTKTWRPF